MNKTSQHNRLGHYITTSLAGESFSAYVPSPLPPNPPLALEPLYPLMETGD